jgi:hypothetical protein
MKPEATYLDQNSYTDVFLTICLKKRQLVVVEAKGHENDAHNTNADTWTHCDGWSNTYCDGTRVFVDTNHEFRECQIWSW